MILSVKQTYHSTLEAVAKNLRDLIGDLLSKSPSMPRLCVAEGYSAATAGEAFSLTHTLGVVPDDVLKGALEPNTGLWATTDDRLAWTDKVIVLRCGATNSPVKVFPFTLR